MANQDKMQMAQVLTGYDCDDCDSCKFNEICMERQLTDQLWDMGWRLLPSGSWVRAVNKAGEQVGIYCSHCTHLFRVRKCSSWKYCPRCGARMGGES